MNADPDGWERLDQRKGTALVVVVLLSMAGAVAALSVVAALWVFR
jgi:hypothetical protein